MPFRQVREGVHLSQSIDNEAELRSLSAKGKLLLIFFLLKWTKKKAICSVNICIAKKLG